MSVPQALLLLLVPPLLALLVLVLLLALEPARVVALELSLLVAVEPTLEEPSLVVELLWFPPGLPLQPSAARVTERAMSLRMPIGLPPASAAGNGRGAQPDAATYRQRPLTQLAEMQSPSPAQSQPGVKVFPPASGVPQVPASGSPPSTNAEPLLPPPLLLPPLLLPPLLEPPELEPPLLEPPELEPLEVLPLELADEPLLLPPLVEPPLVVPPVLPLDELLEALPEVPLELPLEEAIELLEVVPLSPLLLELLLTVLVVSPLLLLPFSVEDVTDVVLLRRSRDEVPLLPLPLPLPLFWVVLPPVGRLHSSV